MGRASQVLVAVGESFRIASALTFPAMIRIRLVVSMKKSSW
jgi:hypothetical protein